MRGKKVLSIQVLLKFRKINCQRTLPKVYFSDFQYVAMAMGGKKIIKDLSKISQPGETAI